jgi:hypothetical protein
MSARCGPQRGRLDVAPKEVGSMWLPKRSARCGSKSGRLDEISSA